MTSFLDDPKVRAAVFPLSVEFYHQAGELGLLGEDIELLEGNLVKKMAKSPLHTWLVQFLHSLLLRSLGPGLSVRMEQPLTLDRSEPEPDLAVVRGGPGDFRHAHPTTAELVIEVAISTVEVDRQKAAIYAAAGIEEYWIVIPAADCVEIHRGLVDGTYAQRLTLTSPARLESSVLSGFAVELGALFQP